MPPTHNVQASRERERASDRDRRSAAPWRGWYSLAVWKQIRERELRAHPYCARCTLDGHTVIATVVNHNPPHRGDWSAFVNGPFETLCKHHHDADVQAEERAGSK